MSRIPPTASWPSPTADARHRPGAEHRHRRGALHRRSGPRAHRPDQPQRHHRLRGRAPAPRKRVRSTVCWAMPPSCATSPAGRRSTPLSRAWPRPSSSCAATSTSTRSGSISCNMGARTTNHGHRFAPTVWPRAARWAFVLAVCALLGVVFSYYWRVFYGLDARGHSAALAHRLLCGAGGAGGCRGADAAPPQGLRGAGNCLHPALRHPLCLCQPAPADPRRNGTLSAHLRHFHGAFRL